MDACYVFINCPCLFTLAHFVLSLLVVAVLVGQFEAREALIFSPQRGATRTHGAYLFDHAHLPFYNGISSVAN